IEQLQGRNEELTAYNEEVMAMNEELQSANEELESSKEEMQSLNEELVITNAILDSKVLALEAANNDISNLLSSTDMATVFLDRTLCIKRYTLAATRLLRLIPADLGRPLADIANNLQGVDLLENALSVLKQGHHLEKEVQDQSGLWYLMRTLPYLDSQGHTAGVVILFADVTRMKQAEEKNNLLLLHLQEQCSLLNHAHVLAMDLEGKIIFWNPGAEEYYGWLSHEALGQSLQQLLKTEGELSLEQLIQQTIAIGQWVGELTHFTREAKKVSVFSHWHLTRDAHGQPKAVVAVNNDLSERKKMEQELRQAKLEAESLSKAKSSFLAVMSHEIRTPLHLILGMSELLKETSLTAEQQSYLRKVEKSGVCLLELINNILDFSKTEAGEMVVLQEAVALPELLQEVITLLSSLSIDKEIDL
ncbi:PAS domain-containing protein, partial [Candidatus Magnetaquicoccus inordinatus]|uniref:PAS domain-containing protein n=1 Tax=Candidatus Magnetaquicoccus inordinatus TaxID=2496818 RepID=UPI00102BD2CD